MRNIFGKLFYLLEKKEDAMLVTIISSDGSTPRGEGSQMLVSSSGHECGTIGGGAVEKASEKLAIELIKTKQSALHEYNLRKGAAADIGMECGGDVRVFFQFVDYIDCRWKELCSGLTEMLEKREAGWFVQHLDGSFPELISEKMLNEGKSEAGEELGLLSKSASVLADESFAMPLPIGERAIIFGGGHCAHALAPILDSVGFRVTVMDCREEFVTEERFPMAERRICGDFTSISDYLNIERDDYLVVMTNGHLHDYEVQEQILRYDSAYVGVIGSRHKTAAVNERLRSDGVEEERIMSVHTPIGLKIKAVTPAEIAVSIAGEMILVRAELAEQQGELTHSCPMN